MVEARGWWREKGGTMTGSSGPARKGRPKPDAETKGISIARQEEARQAFKKTRESKSKLIAENEKENASTQMLEIPSIISVFIFIIISSY